MAGGAATSLPVLEERARHYQLSESEIRERHKSVLSLFLPLNIVEKLKTCMSKKGCGNSSRRLIRFGTLALRMFISKKAHTLILKFHEVLV